MHQKLLHHSRPFIVVLGIAQDGGIPHCGCEKPCCQSAWEHIAQRKHAACIALCDPHVHKRFLIDMTPDSKDQLHALNRVAPKTPSQPILDGIAFTHGHVGHIIGLYCLEKAIMNTHCIPVFAMPKMRKFLSENLPWRTLIAQHNISIRPMKSNRRIRLTKQIFITPFLVPHQGEYSETVGFSIRGPSKTVLYIPDIDTLDPFPSFIRRIQMADVVFLDGTFFNGNELPERNIHDVPHPYVQTSIKRLMIVPKKKRKHIFFTHLNHSNPALVKSSAAYAQVQTSGFRIAREGEVIYL